MKHLKKVLTDAEIVAQDYNVLYYSEESGNITFKEAEEPSIPNNEIWYEASEKLTETTSTYSFGLHTNAFGDATITSHTFENGIGKVVFDKDVTIIDYFAFNSCISLITVNIPSSVTSIGDSAFEGCINLTSVMIPNSVTSIGLKAFSNCSDLTSVTIPNSVTSIGDYAFEACDGLTSVTIPNSVTSIGSAAFAFCTSLTSVNIPSSVTTIGQYAFYNVPEIVYNGTATGSPWGALSIRTE